MAVEWYFESRLERGGATRVCARVYEELDELMEELGANSDNDEFDDPKIEVLHQLRVQLTLVLPFNPQEK